MSRLPTDQLSEQEAAEGFLGRWSRVKREVAAGAVPAGTVEKPVQVDLPLPETLDLQADFTAFMHTKVEASVRRAALQKLFHLPVFNVMDGLDTYIDDYNVFEPIPTESLKDLVHAQSMLFPEMVEARHIEERAAEEHAKEEQIKRATVGATAIDVVSSDAVDTHVLTASEVSVGALPYGQSPNNKTLEGH